MASVSSMESGDVGARSLADQALPPSPAVHWPFPVRTARTNQCRTTDHAWMERLVQRRQDLWTGSPKGGPHYCTVRGLVPSFPKPPRE